MLVSCVTVSLIRKYLEKPDSESEAPVRDSRVKSVGEPKRDIIIFSGSEILSQLSYLLPRLFSIPPTPATEIGCRHQAFFRLT